MTPYYAEPGITIYHADCRDVLPLLPADSVRLLWTDPPYGYNNQAGDLQSSRVGVPGARQRPAVPIMGDTREEAQAAVTAMLTQAARVLMRESCCCCCCCGGGGPEPAFAELAQRMDRDGLRFFHACVWDKAARGPGLGWRFRRDYEFVMLAHRAGGRMSWAPDQAAVSNILRYAPEANIWHPTTKPVAMLRSFILWTTGAGDLVLDPFMGSGTTLIAARSLGRPAIGIDVDQRYCEAAADRLRQRVFDFQPAAEAQATPALLDLAEAAQA